MRRLLLLAAIVSLLAGCQTSAPTRDESQEKAPTMLVTGAPAIVAPIRDGM